MLGRRKPQPWSEEIAQAVWAFAQAESVSACKHVVMEYWGALDTDWAEWVLLNVLSQARAAGDEETARKYKQLAKLLARCRREGIDAAFSDIMPLDRLAELMNEIQRLTEPWEMPRRVQACEEALQLSDREKQPALWAGMHGNLATSLAQNPQGEHSANLERAIVHLKIALEIFTRKDYPLEWAMTQVHLGHIFRDRAECRGTDNIEEAIHHFEEALHVLTRDEFPLQWADIQNGLGLVYADRVRGDRAANIERAIYHYELALQKATLDTDRLRWADVCCNLAAAYANRLEGVRAANLRQAVAFLREVEDENVFTPTEDAFRWGMLQNGLATAYAQRIDGDRSEHLQTALDYYRKALEVIDHSQAPMLWASIHQNMANVYCEPIHRKRPEHIDQAISHYQAALTVYRRETSPEPWAEVQNGLGNAYSFRLETDKAIASYRAALQVYTLEDFPAECRMVSASLGDEYFIARDWNAACEAYNTALCADHLLLSSAYTEPGRRTEVIEAAQLYPRAAYCLLKMGKLVEAFLKLEQGKTRLLRETLAQNNLDLASLPPQERQAFAAGRAEVRELEAQLRLSQAVSSRVELARKLREARSELLRRITGTEAEWPPTLGLSDILALIPQQGALVVPLVTRLAGSAVFVIPQGVNTIEDSHVLFLSGMADMMLHRLLGYEATVHPEWKDWKSAYELFRQMDTLSSHDNWLTELEAFTGSLWHALMGPIHDRLAQLGVSQVLILPQGGLQLLPLHAAWCEEGGKRRYFSDDFVVSYAPSAYALHACCRRATERCGRSALVVGVDEYTKLKPLLSATAEAKAIAGIFGATPLLNSSATDRAVIEHAAHSAYVHLSCHGHFISEGNPLDSALYLGGDTQLSLSDIISRLDLGAARLAVLSACETGIVESSDAPDECIGLSAGFIEAGAPAVISTLWIVDDRSTRLLLEQFYQNHFNHGMTLPLALKEAQKWLRDRVGDENYAHPYYWAAFTLTGV